MEHRQQKVFDADVFVLHRFGLLGRVDEQRAELARLVDLLFAALDGRQLGERLIDLFAEELAADAEFFEQRRNEAVLLAHQGGQHMNVPQLGIAVADGDVLGFEQRFAAFVGEFFHVHNQFSFSCMKAITGI